MASRMLVTLSSDFGVQSQGVGAMEAMVFLRAPEAKVIHLMHGLPEFDVIAAARTMETLRYLPCGIHVCVCDPGVGSSRRGVAIQVERGDIFIGPDNGIFPSACELLDGIIAVRELTNDRFHRRPVSPIFHGRDIFASVAGFLAAGVEFEQLGPAVDPDSLEPTPYTEARPEGNGLVATVIQVNRFGSLHLNILHEQWDSLGHSLGETISIRHPTNRWEVEAQYGTTFSDVAPGEIVVLKDDYGRVEVASNRSSFAQKYATKIGDELIVG